MEYYDRATAARFGVASKKKFLHPGNSIAFVARHARSLFRPQVWQQVGSLLANARGLDNGDSFTALRHTNYNSTRITAKGDPSLVSVVMLDINPGVPPRPHANWTDGAISETVRCCSKYGDIQKGTHIIVQLFFKGMCNRGGKAGWPTDEAVGVILMSANGMMYTYNVPRGVCEQLAYRVMSRLLFVTTGTFPSGVLRVINYKPRPPFDDHLYALYLTSATAAESREQALKDRGGYAEIEAVDLSTCRPSARYCRHTRVVGNLRFLMLLCKPLCVEVDLMLDETNTLDTFRLTVK